MTRRIIQIAVSPGRHGEPDTLYALTDMSEVWELSGGHWSRLEPLPPDERWPHGNPA
jgi:hypothetical protein